mgnify:CR=1 FL=1
MNISIDTSSITKSTINIKQTQPKIKVNKKCRQRYKRYNKLLQKYYGYSNLKEKQLQIIDLLLHDKKDVSGILSTGYGKSVCFQIPYLYTRQCIIVISPLIALMYDQVKAMNQKGITAM